MKFLGKRDDIPELLNEADYIILPSKYEGLLVVLVEAQAAEVPCFISNTITEEVDIGLCSRIDISKTPSECANEIINYIDSKTYKNRLDKNKLDKFNIKNVAKTMENIYLGNY